MSKTPCFLINDYDKNPKSGVCILEKRVIVQRFEKSPKKKKPVVVNFPASALVYEMTYSRKKKPINNQWLYVFCSDERCGKKERWLYYKTYIQEIKNQQPYKVEVDSKQDYFFFLSPVRLDNMAIKKLKTIEATKFFPQKRFDLLDENEILVPNVINWVEEIYTTKYLRNYKAWNRHNGRKVNGKPLDSKGYNNFEIKRAKVFIANTLVQLMGKNDEDGWDPKKINPNKPIKKLPQKKPDDKFKICNELKDKELKDNAWMRPYLDLKKEHNKEYKLKKNCSKYLKLLKINIMCKAHRIIDNVIVRNPLEKSNMAIGVKHWHTILRYINLTKDGQEIMEKVFSTKSHFLPAKLAYIDTFSNNAKVTLSAFGANLMQVIDLFVLGYPNIQKNLGISKAMQLQFIYFGMLGIPIVIKKIDRTNFNISNSISLTKKTLKFIDKGASAIISNFNETLQKKLKLHKNIPDMRLKLESAKAEIHKHNKMLIDLHRKMKNTEGHLIRQLYAARLDSALQKYPKLIELKKEYEDLVLLRDSYYHINIGHAVKTEKVMSKVLKKVHYLANLATVVDFFDIWRKHGEEPDDAKSICVKIKSMVEVLEIANNLFYKLAKSKELSGGFFKQKAILYLTRSAKFSIASQVFGNSLGAAAGQLNIILGVLNLGKAFNTGNTGQIIGSGLVIAGGLVGKYVLIAAIVTGTSPVIGWVAAGLILAGSALYTFCSKSDWQNFAQHCIYGKYHNERFGDGGTEKLWLAMLTYDAKGKIINKKKRSFSNLWTKESEIRGLLEQERVLKGLLSGFQVVLHEEYTESGIKLYMDIIPGILEVGSYFDINIDIKSEWSSKDCKIFLKVYPIREIFKSNTKLLTNFKIKCNFYLLKSAPDYFRGIRLEFDNILSIYSQVSLYTRPVKHNGCYKAYLSASYYGSRFQTGSTRAKLTYNSKIVP